MEWWTEENFISAIEILCSALREIGDRYSFIANDEDRLEDKELPYEYTMGKDE